MADYTTGFVDALKQIRADPAKSHQFMQDPHGTLAEYGVHVGKSASGALGATPALGVCVGACVCVG
jgi:hypothetical protein